jgi:HEPN domain-containing protein
MPGREKVLEVVRGWVAKAENDFKNATHTLKLGDDCPADTVCFHAQQCVEKYLKAALVHEGIDFPKTHDLEEIVVLLPARLRVSLTIEEQRWLTGYATAARYPGWPDVSLAEARQAIALARRVRKEVRGLLPKAVLRRRR